MTTAAFRCIPGREINRIRSAPSEYNSSGDWVQGAETIEPVEGVIQPITAKAKLSERMISEIDNNRSRAWVVVYTDLDTFIEQDERAGIQADLFEYRGNRYEVMMVDNWDAGVLDHQKAIAARLDPRDGD